MTKADVKTTMYLHSEAKVEFYRIYLSRYLRILLGARAIQEVHVFDVFCGTGIYDNGKKGSPIVAIDAINEIGDAGGITKQVGLHVNDSNAGKIESVSAYLETNDRQHCTIDCQNKPADEMFADIIGTIEKQSPNVRNLIFVDPYGYKEIKKDVLQRLLSNKRTEIFLFLPIAQMQRFTSHALQSDEKPYEPLKNFVQSFFPQSHPIRNQTISHLEYIDYIKDALKFDGKNYSTSYYIERDANNYYGLFFMSSHLYGFDRILHVKWDLDENDGRGFRLPDPSPRLSLFAELEKDLAREENFEKLEKILESALASGPKNNCEMYEIILANEFLGKHASEVFRRWQGSKSGFSVIDLRRNAPARKGTFCIGWDHYKTRTPKIEFRLESI
ncbi:MAG: three-Cys-motif partner protein TcmP [Pyrinomonadaceae bacterium]|nr:three-Cys-motif partner protein TcmP [Pyrinomonadaceae bacterium]